MILDAARLWDRLPAYRSVQMNHGGRGLITKEAIEVPSEILSTLRVRDRSTLTVLYYPKPAHEAYQTYPGHHDFMITPIPERLWPYVARMKVRLRHVHGSVAAVTALFAERGINILSADCGRSSHRYATFIATVDFERLHESTIDALKDERAIIGKYRQIEIEIAGLRDEIQSRCGEFLFREFPEPETVSPVEGQPIGALNYFCRVARKRPARQDSLSEPFDVECQGNALLLSPKGVSVMRTIFGDQLPLATVAQVDTRLANIRVAAFLPEQASRMRTLSIAYDRKDVAEEDRASSSCGLLAGVTQELARRNISVWQVYNNTEQNLAFYESGTFEFVAEADNAHTWVDIDRAIRQSVHVRGCRIRDIELHTLDTGRVKIFVSMRTRQKRRAEFLSACRRAAQLEGAEIVTVDTNVQSSVTNAVVDLLPRCGGMLQFFYLEVRSGSDDRDGGGAGWLQAEHLAARVAGIPVVRIADRRVWKRIKVDRDQAVIDLELAAEPEDLQVAVGSAIKQLVATVRGETPRTGGRDVAVRP